MPTSSNNRPPDVDGKPFWWPLAEKAGFYRPLHDESKLCSPHHDDADLSDILEEFAVLVLRAANKTRVAVDMLAPVAAPAVAAMKQRPEFMPVIGTRRTLYVPMEILSEQQALANHSQSLTRLAERGGLSLGEIVANIYGLRLTAVEHNATTDQYLRDIEKAAERQGRR